MRVDWSPAAGAATKPAAGPALAALPPERLPAAPAHIPSVSQTRDRKGATMAIERTLSIIKPDATRRNLTGKVNACLEAAGLRIIAQKRLQLTQAQAEAFYAVHKERPFYRDLVTFMTSGPVVAQVLEGENAVLRNRDTMGATDPKKAAPGTIP